MRDKIVYRVCNLMLKFATKDYQTKVALLIKQGMFHAETGTGPFLKAPKTRTEHEE